VRELLDDSFGCYIWPSAIVLSSYIIKNKDIFDQKNSLDLGSGVGLSGLVLASIGSNVILTDSQHNLDVMDNLKHSVKFNNLSKNATVQSLDWGEFDKHETDLLSCKFDFIFGSDIFYNPCHFDSILATVFYVLKRNPNACFITAYQERSSKRTLEPLLRHWGMVGKALEAPSIDEIISECCFIKGGMEDKDSMTSIVGLDSIFLFQINLAP
jgi:predicted nicotinamide N-methyase